MNMNVRVRRRTFSSSSNPSYTFQSWKCLWEKGLKTRLDDPTSAQFDEYKHFKELGHLRRAQSRSYGTQSRWFGLSYEDEGLYSTVYPIWPGKALGFPRRGSREQLQRTATKDVWKKVEYSVSFPQNIDLFDRKAQNISIAIVLQVHLSLFLVIVDNFSNKSDLNLTTLQHQKALDVPNLELQPAVFHI